jgi:acetyl esterase/lipase
MTSAPPGETLRSRFPGLDPGIATLLEAARAAALPPLTALSPDELRERVQGGDGLCAPGPDMLDVADVALPDGLGTRRYTPHRLRTQTALVWFHGGGWVTGTLDYSDGFCRMLADGLGCEVHSIDYRLAPEHRFPAAVEDALTAARCVGDGRQVVVGGDSAGGNLAAVCAQQVHDVPSTRICGQLLVYPVLDSDTTRSSYLRNAGLRHCGRRTCVASRQRSSPWPVMTRSTTRAWRMRRRCGPLGYPSSCSTSRHWCTASCASLVRSRPRLTPPPGSSPRPLGCSAADADRSGRRWMVSGCRARRAIRRRSAPKRR